MKYLIPLWYLNREASEIVPEGAEKLLVSPMIIGLFITMIQFLYWFIIWELPGGIFFRILSIGILFFALPNYFISYLYYKKDKDQN